MTSIKLTPTNENTSAFASPATQPSTSPENSGQNNVNQADASELSQGRVAAPTTNNDPIGSSSKYLLNGLTLPHTQVVTSSDSVKQQKETDLDPIFQKQRQALCQRYEAAKEGAPIHFVFLPTRCQGLPPSELDTFYQSRYLWECARAVTEFPNARVSYVTNDPVHRENFAELVKYHPDADKILARTNFVAIGGNASDGIQSSLLHSEEALETIRSLGKPEETIMRCFASQPELFSISEKLGNIPVEASHSPLLDGCGTKSGGREIFSRTTLDTIDGANHIHHMDQLVSEMSKLWLRNPTKTKFMVKLNEAVSGQGNAIVSFPKDVDPASLRASERADIVRNLVTKVDFRSTAVNSANFPEVLAELGCAIEVRATGDSVEEVMGHAFIHPNGEIEFLAPTLHHVLNGAHQGAAFPAPKEYSDQIQQATIKVGEELRELGAVGYYGLDYLAVKNDGKTRFLPLEINLRQGGSVHGLGLAKLVTGAKYDQATATLRTESGECVHYRLNNHILDQHSNLWKNRPVSELEAALNKSDLLYNDTKGCGVILHLKEALQPTGHIGFLVVGRNNDEVDSIYQQASQIMQNGR